MEDGATNFGQDVYLRKFASEFSVEMTRSVMKMMESWLEQTIYSFEFMFQKKLH